MMKKVLVYHLYAKDYISNNKCYSIHKECLKYYKNVFDELIFYIVVDDLEDSLLITDIINWVTDICKGLVYSIKIRKNTKLCEVQTFKEEILDNQEKHSKSHVFFAHSKNMTRLDNELNGLADTLSNSIIKWCLSLYFYSLNFIDELENKFYGCPYPGDLFYGPILTKLRDKSIVKMMELSKSGCYYQGTFYWINMPKFINYLKNGLIKPLLMDDRFWCEILPGVICGDDENWDGCGSHNYAIIYNDFNLYDMDKDEWKNLIEILGNSNEFWEFHDCIMKKVLEKRDG